VLERHGEAGLPEYRVEAGEGRLALHAHRHAARRLVGELKQRSGDFREGVRSYVERRAPSFEPLSAPVDLSDYEETR